MKLCSGNEATIEAILASESIALTPEQVEALTLELAKPRYSGLTTAQVLVTLRDPQVAWVEEAVVWKQFRGVELKRFLSTPINQITAAALGGSASAQTWLSVIGAQLAKTLDTDVLNPAEDLTLRGLADQLVAAGFATQQQRDELLTRIEPAHNETQPCPLEALGVFEAGYALEPSDVEACR